MLLLCFTLTACGGGNGDTADPLPDNVAANPLQPDEVAAIMNAAARALDQQIAVAVTDRRGVVLGVGTNFGMNENDYRQRCVTVACPLPLDELSDDCLLVEIALQLARTAAMFSADQTPLTSRSIRFLSGEHFPPGIKNTGAAALFGVENTNRGCSLDATETPEPLMDTLPRPKSLSASLRAPQLTCDSLGEDPERRCGCTRGIATFPGGVPIYKNGRMSGGVGVVERSVQLPPDPIAAFDGDHGEILRLDDGDEVLELAEFAARAFAGDDVGIPTLKSNGLTNVCSSPSPPLCCTADPPCSFGILPAPPPLPFDPVIFVDGIEIPEVELKPHVSGVGIGAPLTEPLIVAPVAGETVPSGWLIPARSGTDAQPLSAVEVEAIIAAGVQEADSIRAAIRLPLKARTKMVLAVTDTNGALLGVFRMNDATVFSIDVAIAKARNVSYFSSDQINSLDTLDCPGLTDCSDRFFSVGCAADPDNCTAITNRTIGFGAQPFFPPGIDSTDPGPFRRIFITDSGVPCTNASQSSNGRQNGVVFFPGSAPLYKDGVLVGGLGVSGDGVEQDDLVTFAATRAAPGFEPAADMRADQLRVRGARLPYLKFNRRPGE